LQVISGHLLSNKKPLLKRKLRSAEHLDQFVTKRLDTMMLCLPGAPLQIDSAILSGWNQIED